MAMPKAQANYDNIWGGVEDAEEDPQTKTPTESAPVDDPIDQKFWDMTESEALSVKDQQRMDAMSKTQAAYWLNQETNRFLADAVASVAHRMTVKELKAGLTQWLSVLSVLPAGTVLPAYVHDPSLAKVHKVVFKAKLKSESVSTEVFILPSKVFQEAAAVFPSSVVEASEKKKDHIIFHVAGFGPVPVYDRAHQTDEAVKKVLAALTYVTRRDYKTVPLVVERFISTALILSPMKIVDIPGMGSRFEDASDKNTEMFLRQYAPPAFHKEGVLVKALQSGFFRFRGLLNSKVIPPGVPKKILLQACAHVLRAGVLEKIEHIAKEFFVNFKGTIDSVLSANGALFARCMDFTFQRIPDASVLGDTSKLPRPMDALLKLHGDRRFRQGSGFDDIVDHVTQNNPYADSALGGAVKLSALFAAAPPPPGKGKTVALGVSKGHDKNVYPPGTEFYDIKPKPIEGINVRHLDVLNMYDLEAALKGANTVYSDVCPNLPKVIQLEKIASDCAYTANENIYANLCKAVMNSPDVTWFALKMFLPPRDVLDIPPYLFPLMARFGFMSLKPGKMHNDEFYLIFSSGIRVTKDLNQQRAKWAYVMCRNSVFTVNANEMLMRAACVGSPHIYATMDAVSGWVALKPAQFPFAGVKGTAFKYVTSGMDASGYVKIFQSTWEAEGKEEEGAAPPLVPPRSVGFTDPFAAAEVAESARGDRSSPPSANAGVEQRFVIVNAQGKPISASGPPTVVVGPRVAEPPAPPPSASKPEKGKERTTE